VTSYRSLIFSAENIEMMWRLRRDEGVVFIPYFGKLRGKKRESE